MIGYHFARQSEIEIVKALPTQRSWPNSCAGRLSHSHNGEVGMPHSITRREFVMATSAAGVAAFGLPLQTQADDAKTLRFIMRNDLRVLDPMWTTAYVTRNHGYMVFDTLFALDAKFQPQPQMVGDYSISADKLVYTFTLRDGLSFHDSQPVRAADCVASLKRWMARDSVGQTLAAITEEMTGGDGKTFSIR